MTSHKGTGGAKYDITLYCHHVITLRDPCPQRGDIVWCTRCRAESTVLNGLANFRLRCRDCRLSQGFARGKLAAQRGADRHAQKCPTHAPYILNGDRVWEQRRPLSASMDELPFDKDHDKDSDIPPF